LVQSAPLTETCQEFQKVPRRTPLTLSTFHLHLKPEKEEKIEHSEESRRIQKNPEESRRIQKNPEESRRIQKNPEKSRRILKNPEKS